ncbi:hypothetical protein [Peijinzhouia sedimentorum]
MRIIITISFILGMLKASGQVLIDTTKYYETANVGTVKQITNNEVCAIVVFVSSPQNNWEMKNKKKVLNRDRRAFKKINNELKKYNVNLNIHFEIFNLDQDFKIDSIVDYKNPPVVRDPLNKSNEYKKNNAKKIWTFYSNSEIPFFKKEEYLLFEGGYFLIIYHEGLGVSTASPALLNGYEEQILPEHITVFEFDQNWRKKNKNVTAHETLHLFGAWDIYKNTTYGFQNEEYNFILERYPRSIMRTSKQTDIDDITAWRIGINNNPQPWFLETVPRIYHKNFHVKQ